MEQGNRLNWLIVQAGLMTAGMKGASRRSSFLLPRSLSSKLSLPGEADGKTLKLE